MPGGKETRRGKQMLLADNLPVGHYKILTVESLTNHFRVSDVRNALSPRNDVRGRADRFLERTSQTVSHEFFPLWIEKTVEIDYKADRGACTRCLWSYESFSRVTS